MTNVKKKSLLRKPTPASQAIQKEPAPRNALAARNLATTKLMAAKASAAKAIVAKGLTSTKKLG